MKNGVGSGVGSGSISQRYGSWDPDPDPHQNIMNSQHCPRGKTTLSRHVHGGT
jgi:hypothetical protein